MKISYKWLKELLPGLKIKPDKLAQKLTLAGLEVESVDKQGNGIEKVVVGLVQSVAKHPNADRLSLCEVTNGKQIYQVVCGAPNVKANKKYPFALEGGRLPTPKGAPSGMGMELKRVKIRGVESRGMLCSAKELGISDESKGILELPDSAPVGKSFVSYYGFNDAILDVATPPNRGDCISHWGMAREIAAVTALTFVEPKIPSIKGSYPIKDYVSVQLKDARGCGRYCSRIIRDVSIGASPQWLSQRLESLGIRSINNVVDATNYVMMETGHPLHAFDHRFLRDHKLIIRKAGSPQKFTTLDDEVKELVPDDLLIADGQGPVALAGIMGGKNSEVREDTHILVLEAAYFDSKRIRRTARRLGIQTESSYRFERVVNSQTVRQAIDRLTQFICELAGGEASRETVDIYPKKVRPLKLTLRKKRVDQIVGTSFKSSEITPLLKRLRFKPQKVKTGWKLTIPVDRNDVTREIDVIEEVVRLKSYDKIPSSLPQSVMKHARQSAGEFLNDEVRNFFRDQGFYETIHTSFCDPEEFKKLGLMEPKVIVDNPLSQEDSALRSSLLPGLLGAYTRNRAVSDEGLKFFELRPIYQEGGQQSLRLAGIYGGSKYLNNWQHKDEKIDFFYGKGILQKLFTLAKILEVKFRLAKDQREYHPGQCAQIFVRNLSCGYFGKIHPTLISTKDLKEDIFFFNLDYSFLVQKWGGAASIRYQTLSPFPTVMRDMALVMNDQMENSEVLDTITGLKVPWLKQISLFDLYKGEKIPSGKKSMAFNLVYENPEKTLTDEEVNRIHFKLIDDLKDQLGVTLR